MIERQRLAVLMQVMTLRWQELHAAYAANNIEAVKDTLNDLNTDLDEAVELTWRILDPDDDQ